jgi:poly(A) polymerase
MTEAPVRHADTIIFPASLDPKAVTVVERLTEAGYESYLVGGCVRDLLLGHIPKDFDVSTEARPRQIRRVFRNCRVIGRRFKLAHVHFGQLVIEVATFRRNPEAGELEGSGNGEGDGGGENNDAESDDLLIVRDNVYGTAEEDARRRDFTMNALLYDVGAAEVHDYVGGFEDLQARVLRTIGEPEVRLAEDPVRMLRAIKFTSRLSLTLDPALDAAIHACAGEIEKSAPPRVLEEIYKLLSCGKAEVSLAMLLDYGLLKRLLPEVGAYWEDHRERLVALGRALDQLDHGQRQLSNALMMSVLYHDPWRAQVDADERGDPMAMARDLISPAAVGMSVPRRDVGRLKGLLTTQLRLERPKRGRRMRMTEFLGRGAVQEAIQLLYLRCLAGGADPEVHAAWAERLAWHLGDGGRDEVEVEEPPREGRSRRRRRRGGRRNRRGGREGRGGDDRRESTRDGSGRDERSESTDRPSRKADAAKSDSPKAGTTKTDSPKTRDAATDGRKPQDAAAAGKTGVQASKPAASPRAKAASPDSSHPEKKGLKGFMGRLVRKVLGQEDEQQAPPGGTTGGTPAAAAPDRAEPSSEATPTDAQPEPKDAEAAAPAGSAPYGPAQESEGDAPRPKRRRRRRRRSKGSGSSGGESQASAEGEAASGDSDGAKSGASGSGSEGRSSSSSRRSKRRRGGSKDGGRSSGGKGSDKGGSKGGGRGGKSGGRSGSKSGGRSGGKGGGRDGSRSRSNGSDDKRRGRSDGGRDRDMDATKPSEKSGPSQRHPEDVEDIFDW